MHTRLYLFQPSSILACPSVETLNTVLDAQEAHGSDLLHRAFSYLFPFDSPAWNALMATFYISSFPNFILAFIPKDIDLASLNTM